MELNNPNYVLEQFKNLFVKIVAETTKPTEKLDLNERNYKQNMKLISQVDVSIIFRHLSSIFEQINEFKTHVALEHGWHAKEFDYQTVLRQFCNDHQDAVNIAASITEVFKQRAGLLGFFKGYNNPIETILSGGCYQLNYHQLRKKFSYHSVVLQQSEKKC
ncbi:hypothetical protein A5320_00310 [Rheinheimera sp. SA_1]|uniref:hypothetical protein n=1 Tax=Rheinheimera sp. SA_1 TaxID=1827365 RepID=UPI00080016D0|nr:hypothetical protein [Rheinheimera sp. SA_1]OBP15924.1 hypothetical protein A5320_00310 [Rheinheimera sp. SA_1]